MGEVYAMGASYGPEDLDDSFRELLIDRINTKLSELNGNALMDVLMHLGRLYSD